MKSTSPRRSFHPGLEQLESRLLLATNDTVEVEKLDFLSAEVSSPSLVLYVANKGSDGATGDSLGNSIRTINEAFRRIGQGGGTIFVMPGTYKEHVLNPQGGTSWQTPVRLVAYDPTNRPVIRPQPGANRVMTFASAASQYIEVDGFVMDAMNVKYDAVKITWTTGLGGSHDIRIKNSEIMNSPLQGILTTGHDHGVSHVELIGLNVHDNGTTKFHHGIYISTPKTLVEGSFIHGNAGWGIHNYGGDPSHNLYVYNRVDYNNRANGNAHGIGIYTGHNIQIYGNKVSGKHYVGISVNGKVSNVIVRDNHVVENIATSIMVGKRTGNIWLKNNLVRDFSVDVILQSDREGLVTPVVASTLNKS